MITLFSSTRRSQTSLDLGDVPFLLYSAEKKNELFIPPTPRVVEIHFFFLSGHAATAALVQASRHVQSLKLALLLLHGLLPLCFFPRSLSLHPLLLPGIKQPSPKQASVCWASTRSSPLQFPLFGNQRDPIKGSSLQCQNISSCVSLVVTLFGTELSFHGH